MRETKFRGRRTHDKQWIIGSLVIDKNGDKHIIPFDYFEMDGHHLRYEDDSDKPVFFDQETVTQYTGLHDKDGKEIYENDILEDVYGNIGTAHWYGSGFEFINTSGMMENGKDWLIIGSIHENPELPGEQSE